MGYKKPSLDGITYAMENGWCRAEAERGYDIFDFDGTGLLEVERIDSCYTDNDDVTDNDCAMEAERSGFCKIIPVNELPDPFIIEGTDRRWYGWVDTPDNRRAIEDWCKAKEK